ncbi:MAG: nickel-dependent hydrogenase large subunit [Chromatiales bacterium]|nr:nickel-dependent hydrogenase large subunit [Chromatiales bacterium]
MNPGGGIEGGIDIKLVWQNWQVSDVVITSTRPLQTPKIFIGKTAEQVLATLPLLYSVCGTAQAMAAVTASERALGLESSSLTRLGRQLLVSVETAKEHLWRMLLDWPGFLKEQPDHASVAQVVKLQGEMRQLLDSEKALFLPGRTLEGIPAAELLKHVETLESQLKNSIYCIPCEQWLGFDEEQALGAWTDKSDSIAARMLRWIAEQGWQSLGSNEIAFLPELSHEELDATFASDTEGDFIAAPTWKERCYETTSLSRQAGHKLIRSVTEQYGNGLFTRLVARLVELAKLPGQLRFMLHTAVSESTSKSAGSGAGLSEVEAARGRLIHRVEIDSEAVSRYQILAPTEWNFHPRGVLAQSLMALQPGSESELEQQARLMVNAIDPCVGYTLRIN